MQNKIFRLLFVSFALLFFVSFSNPEPVQATDTDDYVMLVYDSKNTTAGSEKQIDALQRALTSMNLRVKTVDQADYKSGMLTKKYFGVISMVNWKQMGFTNKKFLKDRNNFSGIKLHIGNDLSGYEASELGAKSVDLYQQQLILENKKSNQMLPFSETITVLDNLSKESQMIGTLRTQQADQKTYGYGVINGKYGYLPYFSSKGLSYLTAVEMIAKLFSKQGSYQPILTVTGVTPVSDLKILDQVSQFCYKNSIPFAVSTTSVSNNTGMKAFARFVSELRNVENRGGVVFIKSPEVGGAGVGSANELRQDLTSYVVSLAKYQVYPIGISTDGFWNQDKILRKNFLMNANHWLLLPNGKVTYIDQDNNSQIAHTSFLGISASSLNSVNKSYETRFSTPTAIYIPLPHSNKELVDFKEQINKLDFSWFNPMEVKMSTAINTGTSTVSFRDGNYFVNGKQENIGTADSSSVFSEKIKEKPLLSNYFNIQGSILTILFVIVTIVLIIFILMGRRIYWNRFNKRK
ncbi:hypothetical protein [Companilactobacillus insicii]|uniref:hypothetical protein n=1 Tax=Companilactobacillus insicii TaxID=1732567 RepID=UPI000F76EDDE|nr:hypothetical protein [Companilactobacillus insicii]